MTSANRFLAVAIVAMFVASGFIVVAGNDSYGYDNADENVVVVETGIKYSGPWALNNALSDTPINGTVKLLRSYTGSAVGIFSNPGTPLTYHVNLEKGQQAVNDGITIDFGGYTLSVQNCLTGGTIKQVFHVENSYSLTLKNGTIKATDGNTGAAMLMQNHGAKLVLDGMVLDGSNLNQGYIGTEPQNVYTLKNDAANKDNSLTVKNSSIIACEKSLKGGKTAFAFDVSQNVVLILMKGNVTIAGSIEFTANTASYTFAVDEGTVTMTSGKIVKDQHAEPIVDLEDESKFLFAKGVQISDMIVGIFRFKNITAGDGGMGVTHGNETGSIVFGNMTTDSTGTVLMKQDSSAAVVYNFGIMGVAGKGVSLQFNDNNATIVGALRICAGASWSIKNKPVGATDESFIVVERGAKYLGEDVTENVSYKVDTKGNLIPVFLILFETSDHVKSISYEGESYLYSVGGQGAVVDLSKVEVTIDSGYELRGFQINGILHGADEKVTVTETGSVVKAVVSGDEPQPSGPGSNNGMVIIGAVLIVFVALIFLITVFSKKN